VHDVGLMAEIESPIAAPTRAALVRVSSRFDLTAAVVNGVMGSAIFGLPAALAAPTGAGSPIAPLLAGLGALTSVLSLAEVASRPEQQRQKAARVWGAVDKSRAAFTMAGMGVPLFHEVRQDVVRILRDQGGLSAILVDFVSLAKVERVFGEGAYRALRAQIEPVLGELKARVRLEDILARDDRREDRVVLFLSRQRDRGPFAMADLRQLAERVEQQLAPRVGRLTQPYFKERGQIDVGYGFVINSPLETEDRQFLRIIDECVGAAELRRRLREREEHETLFEVIHNRNVWTAFQPIVEMETRQVMGHEGLSRGPRGTEIEPPTALFRAAARYGMTEELERACRRQAFVDWEIFGAPGRLFVNTVPATVRDSSFLGRGVLDYLGPRLSPRLMTLEINERQVIENLNLYREAMHAFLDLGFTFAIDDVGAGYSGLETMASLGASYLKIDMGLVRDVHQKRVSQQIVRAILDMAGGVGAAVIAEGIECQEEADALISLGVRYGQGYFFARPLDPYAPKPQAASGPAR